MHIQSTFKIRFITKRRSNRSILKEINLGYSLEGLMLREGRGLQGRAGYRICTAVDGELTAKQGDAEGLGQNKAECGI